MDNKNKDKNCEICYKIKCRGCGWEPDDAESDLLNKGLLTKCPDCGGGR